MGTNKNKKQDLANIDYFIKKEEDILIMKSKEIDNFEAEVRARQEKISEKLKNLKIDIENKKQYIDKLNSKIALYKKEGGKDDEIRELEKKIFNVNLLDLDRRKFDLEGADIRLSLMYVSIQNATIRTMRERIKILNDNFDKAEKKNNIIKFVLDKHNAEVRINKKYSYHIFYKDTREVFQYTSINQKMGEDFLIVTIKGHGFNLFDLNKKKLVFTKRCFNFIERLDDKGYIIVKDFDEKYYIYDFNGEKVVMKSFNTIQSASSFKYMYKHNSIFRPAMKVWGYLDMIVKSPKQIITGDMERLKCSWSKMGV